MLKNSRRIHFAVLLPCSLLVARFMLTAQVHHVDYQYSPQKYFTALCFPEDWQKTLVSESGSLLYDFGPGPYARALTEVSIGIEDDSLVTIHQSSDPGGFMSTILSTLGTTIRQEAFALLPAYTHFSKATKKNSVERIGGLNGCANWARPPADVDPAFRNVAWGTNRPIRYRVRVKAGSRKRVAIGLCESYKPGAGTRIMELRVEGAHPVTIDPLEGKKKNEPVVSIINARDVDRDGWLKIEVHASPLSPDPNVILNAFWVFPETVQVSSDAIIRGTLTSRAEIYHTCGTEAADRAPYLRMDAIVSNFTGMEVTPIVSVRTRRVLVLDSVRGTI
ncbi:MAG: hypothetical protein ABI623_02810, partial [bacterium]